MLTGPPRSRRARPVADAPIDALLARTEDLTKGWLLALLERAPLDDAPRILAADLTQDGPRVCAALLRAIGDDTDHRRLEPGGALEPLVARVGELAGAAGAAATSLAVDALQSVIWSALRAELRDPDPELVSELAERLTQVTGLMRVAALAHAHRPRPRPAPRPAGGLSAVGGPARAVRRRRRRPRRSRSAEPRRAPAGAGAAPRTARAPEPEPSRPGLGRSTPPMPLRCGSARCRTRSGPAPTRPLSLLLAELEDADRVLAVETGLGVAWSLRGVRRRGPRGRAPPGHPRLRERRPGLDHRP